jgi:hypothetical protein
MSDFFIKYKNIAIHVEDSRKLGGLRIPKCTIININDNDYEIARTRYPYANCVKIDLYEQLTSKNLKRTLPKNIREHILELPEVKAFIRDDKINRILS